jgi:hypothetical protein
MKRDGCVAGGRRDSPEGTIERIQSVHTIELRLENKSEVRWSLCRNAIAGGGKQRHHKEEDIMNSHDKYLITMQGTIHLPEQLPFAHAQSVSLFQFDRLTFPRVSCGRIENPALCGGEPPVKVHTAIFIIGRPPLLQVD